MAESTTDHSILKKIEGLVHEEQHLYGKGELADHDQVRLEAIKIELDQCWDLLRQREARREFGQDPNEAKVRPPLVVERLEPNIIRPCCNRCAKHWAARPMARSAGASWTVDLF